ncbi:hypothetical protein BDR06DRAFT_1037292 [Suillus hirtellus]|nr:hypothetical protein BDR06DRAFT_1037292 [Suillus hirtellus]
MSTINDCASGSDKGQVYGTLAKLIFTDHPRYSHMFATKAKKFRDGVCNCIQILRGKYKKLKASFDSTGSGVMPGEGTQTRNLLDAVLLELPWYMKLDAIWHSNLSMAVKTHSPRSGIDHAGALYSLVVPHAGAGPSIQLDTSAGPLMHIDASAGPLQYPQQPPQIYPPHDIHPSSTPPLHYSQHYYPPAMPYAGGSHGDPPLIQHCNIMLLLPHYPPLPLCPPLALCPPLSPYPPLPPTISPPKSISLAFQHQITAWTWTWTFKAPVAHWMPSSKVTSVMHSNRSAMQSPKRGVVC